MLPRLTDEAVSVIAAHPKSPAAPPLFLYLAQTGPHTPWLPSPEFQGRSAADRIAEGVLKPLNAKLGQSCFALGAVSGTSVGVAFDAACAQPAVRGKIESTPPAGLLIAPPARGKAILKT